VTPHVVRLLFGPDHRLVLPASALCGALLLLLADVVARTIVAPAELPVGIVTALVGGPFFLFLAAQDSRELATARSLLSQTRAVQFLLSRPRRRRARTLPLVTLPSLNATATGMTSQQSGPGSSVCLDLRGYDAIETSTLIDGHPIGQGIDLGFNFQNAPIFALDNVYIGYGTGASGLDAIGAIGGVIDMRTLMPTKTPVTSFLQGVGSYSRATTTATGSTPNGKVGYAFAYGIDGSNGPLGTQTIYSPAASWDTSARALAIVGPATYTLSQDTNRRALLGRLAFAPSPTTQLSLRAMSNNSYTTHRRRRNNVQPAGTT
jgi:hypothetical protein